MTTRASALRLNLRDHLFIAREILNAIHGDGEE